MIENVWMWIIFGLVGVAMFFLIERYALRHPERQWTLSHFMAEVGARFPLSIGILCIFIGGLLVHFFWHFCPDDISTGMLLLR